jgi:hypothetical protein
VCQERNGQDPIIDADAGLIRIGSCHLDGIPAEEMTINEHGVSYKVQAHRDCSTSFGHARRPISLHALFAQIGSSKTHACCLRLLHIGTSQGPDDKAQGMSSHSSNSTSTVPKHLHRNLIVAMQVGFVIISYVLRRWDGQEYCQGRIRSTVCRLAGELFRGAL